jgi:RNA polymerase sigma-70 factor (sigma-E family)
MSAAECTLDRPTTVVATAQWVEVVATLWRVIRAEASAEAPAASSGAAELRGRPRVGSAGAVVDRAALLESLFHREGPSLVRLARLFTEDRNAAEDLVQEAFVRLHHAAHRIEDVDRAAAYLRSIVLNLARDHNRRGLMSLRHFEALTPAASPEAPEDRIELDEQHARMLTALRALSGQQRDCLILRFYFELSEREVADTLGISPNSVKTHGRRGLERLRTMLTERQ